jgi:membrane protease YdiL (CAAX protease family)
MPEALHALTTAGTPNTYRGGSDPPSACLRRRSRRSSCACSSARKGLRDHSARFGDGGHLVALFLPIALAAATIGVSVAAGLSEFNPDTDKPLWYVLLLLLLVGTPVSSVLALGEEYGWRGYLLPKLLPLGEVKASIILALIWAPWHLPLLLAGLNYLGKDPLAVLVFMTAIGIGLSLLFTRVFVHPVAACW